MDTDIHMDIDFELLQLNDSTFPIGAYTLSWGLETFVQQKVIHDSQSALAFLKSDIESNFLTSELLPVRLAYEYAERVNGKKFLALTKYTMPLKMQRK